MVRHSSEPDVRVEPLEIRPRKTPALATSDRLRSLCEERPADALAATLLRDNDRSQQEGAGLGAKAQRSHDCVAVTSEDDLLVGLQRNIAAQLISIERFDLGSSARVGDTDRDGHQT